MKNIYLLLLMISAFVSYNALSQPSIYFDGGPSHDFGEVLIENSPYDYTIIIRNTGDADLKILDLEKDCGCTWAPLEKNLIPPGDSSKINIKQTFTYVGNVTKQLTFKTNDPDNETIYFSLHAKVSSLSNVSAQVLDFKEIYVGNEAKAHLSINNESSFDVRILKIRCNNPEIKFNIKNGDIIPKNGKLNIEASIKPSQVGSISETIYIMTNDKNMGKITINVTGTVSQKF